MEVSVFARRREPCGALTLCLIAVMAVCTPSILCGQRIQRRVPPAGIELPAAELDPLRTRLTDLRQSARLVAADEYIADVTCLLKAVDLALRHNEFYKPTDVKKAAAVLDLAAKRLKQIVAGKPTWPTKRGLIVRGFVSKIDGSPQPYGLVIPQELDLSQKNRLYVWLHGRGDKTTDLHFIDQRLKSAGQVTPIDAIVLHPFGRQCIGFKSAGEIDVLEAIEHVSKQYGIDDERIVLMGFSMGGAGAWHLGAHYADRWVALSPGAGFAETAQYNRLVEADYPPWYEQRLWSLYDVPNYARNLFNLPVVAYSGEVDKQIQAAQVMEEAFRQHGRELTHLIGPGMGHRYHADVLADIKMRMRSAADAGRNPSPKSVFLQTRTLRYASQFWVTLTRLTKHWDESRVDAHVIDDTTIRLTTENVAALSLSYWDKVPPGGEVRIDGKTISLASIQGAADVALVYRGEWMLGAATTKGLSKRPGLQGPMDDLFLTPFLVVIPSDESGDAAVQKWLEFEIQHLKERWPALFRGELPIVRDVDVTEEDLKTKSILVWGTPETNSLLRQAVMGDGAHTVPLKWKSGRVEIDGKVHEGRQLVPAMVYPSPWASNRYILINSGPTFREAHDRTNSLQNPKLPDWAVIDISIPPSDSAPGRIVDAGFFDESWRVPH